MVWNSRETPTSLTPFDPTKLKTMVDRHVNEAGTSHKTGAKRYLEATVTSPPTPSVNVCKNSEFPRVLNDAGSKNNHLIPWFNKQQTTTNKRKCRHETTAAATASLKLRDMCSDQGSSPVRRSRNRTFSSSGTCAKTKEAVVCVNHAFA